MTKTIDLLTLGSIYLDINAFEFPVEKALEIETETVGGSYKLELGGSALNIAKTAGALNVKPAFIGKVGNDMPGNHLKTLLKKHHIKPGLIIDTTVQTNFGISYINSKGKAVMTVVGTANQSLNPSDVMSQLQKLLPKTKLLYLSGYFKLKELQSHYPTILKLAHKHHAKIVLDHGRITNHVTDNQLENLRQLLPHIDIYLPSRSEFNAMMQTDSIKSGLSQIKDEIPNLEICVKADQEGAYSIDSSKSSLYQPAHKIKPVHTIGAGDTFNAGYLLAQIKNKSQQEKMEWGNAAAAIKISTGKLPTFEKLKQQLSQSLT